VSDLTPFQTVGPFFAVLLAHPAPPGAPPPAGEPLVVEGTVRDGTGAPVPDALLEAWHPDQGVAVRAPTDEAGRFVLRATRPSPQPGPGGAAQAPHLAVGVLARGVLTRLVTRVYLDDEPGTAADPVLALVPAARRGTLVARREAPGRYRWDLVLQGPGETVFLDV
jgi:protocatechuate 3,4-dioxygenase, alpha subunit